MYDINQELATVDLYRSRTEEKLILQIKQAEQAMSAICQRFVSAKRHINEKQAVLASLLDKNLETLMQEEYAEKSIAKKDEMTALQQFVKRANRETITRGRHT